MSDRHFQWLPLSTAPSQPQTKLGPDTLSQVCGACGWPNDRVAETCTHCGMALAAPPLPALDLPAPEIVMAEDIREWMWRAAPDRPEVWRLRLQSERAQLTTGLEQLICLDDIVIDHYPHQLDSALRVLRDMRGRALLADEVGLGKTIEAGIVMKELILRGLISSVLILTPAPLAAQWQEEMQAKFLESFTVLERRSQIPAPESDGPRRWICSLDRARRPEWAAELLARPYDLLIVDEAHKLKNRQTLGHRFVDQIETRYVLLLTATPVHNELIELYNLINLVRPGHLGTRREFEHSFTYGGLQRRIITWNTRHSRLASLLRQTRPHQYNLSFGWQLRSWRGPELDRLVLPETTGEDEAQWMWRVIREDVEQGKQALAELRQYLARGYECKSAFAVHNNSDTNLRKLRRSGARFSDAFLEINRRNMDKVYGLRVELVRSNPADKTLPRNPAGLRRLLAEVMIRNRRSEVGTLFPRRRVAVYTLALSPAERALYDGATALIRQLIRDAGRTGPLQMTLMTLQREVCSSPAAAAGTLRKMAADPRYAAVQGSLAALVETAGRVDVCAKAQAVLQILEQFDGQLLIFTDYRATMQYLCDVLERAGIETVAFHGGLSTAEKQEAVRTFRQRARVMVSTESGAEGHNLQFCHQMVNYDLPWNPMRIEQRIGRIHRLGQQHEVLVFNLAGSQTIEAQILNLLAFKIRMFELVVGELDLILDDLGGRSFETLLRDAWLNSPDDRALAQQIGELETLIESSQRTFEQIRQSSDVLSDLLATREEAWAYGIDPQDGGPDA